MLKVWKSKAAVLLLLSATKVTQAKDYGIHEQVLSISEEDGRITMLKSAARTNWGPITEGLIEQSKSIFTNLDGTTTVSPKQVIIRKFDPTIRATKDISAPLLINGEIKWKTIVKKGHSVNPLLEVPSNIIDAYIDLNDPDQISLVNQLTNLKYRIRVIGVKGNPVEAQNTLGTHVYFLQRSFLNSEKVSFTPTLAFSGKGESLGLMIYAAFPKPFSLSNISMVLGR